MKKQYKISLIIIGILVFFGVTIVPIPYYIEQPGSTINLSELITVDNQKDKEPGSFSLTSVGVRQATVATAAISKFMPFNELLSKKDLMGTSTSDEYNQIQNYYMESAQNNATEQALKAAKIPYKMEYKGVYVMSVDKQSTFYGKLAIGDILTSIDGQSFKSSQEMITTIQAKKKDEPIKITFLHDNKEQTLEGKTIKLPKVDRVGIGISLVDHTAITSDRAIKFQVNGIGGPSAGLMFTLEIYQQLTHQDLRKGRQIAGTGTIDSQGVVGRIGGIDKKVASASKEGAKIFLAPNDELTAEDKKLNPGIKTNYEEAKEAAKKLNTDMKIVPIKTLDDALNYLKQ